MTITRLATFTAELQTVEEFTTFITGGTRPIISNVVSRTGTYSYRLANVTHAFGQNIGSRSTIRIGFWIHHQNPSAGEAPRLFIFGNGNDLQASPMIQVVWDSVSGNLQVERRITSALPNEILASVGIPPSLSAVSTQIHVGCTYKAHATDGFLTVYVNGVAVLSLVGDTQLGAWDVGMGMQQLSTSFNTFWICGRVSNSTGAWGSFGYVDDIFVDSYDDELDAPVPARRFLTRIANGAGVDSAWTPLASTNVSQIDDGAPDGGANDGDATYNHTDTVDLRDTFTFEDIAIPTGYRAVAVIPFAHCKTLDVGPEISLHLWDGANYADSADIVPPFDYTIEVADRFTAMPDASAFTEAGINGLSIGVRSRGTFV